MKKMKNIPCWEIIPRDEMNENSIRIPWCFLHGDLETDCKHDVFGFSNKIENFKKLKEGIYNCHYKNKLCTFFYWDSKYGQGVLKKGLVVYNDDIKSLKYAKKCYKLKEESI